MLNERLNDIIDDHYSSIEALKKDLVNILEQYEESVDFQVSNEKNISFLVNNFLDLQ